MDNITRMDIVPIDLKSGNLHRSWLNHAIGSGDSAANAFGVDVFRDGQPVNLNGGAVQGFFRNPMGTNIAITSGGTVDGNRAYITLPQACYAYEGQFTLAIKIIGGGVTGTMRIVDGIVDNTNTDAPVAPTGTVPTYQEVLAQFDAMVAATTAATTAAENVGGIVAPAFDAATANGEGTYVTYEGKLYYLPSGHTAGATWAETTKTETKVGTEVSSLKNALKATKPSVCNSVEASKNLLWISPEYIGNNQNGLVITRSEDGESYIVNGTATAGVYVRLNRSYTADAQTGSGLKAGVPYTFSFASMSGFSTTSRITLKYNYDGASALTNIISQNTSGRVNTITFDSEPYLMMFFPSGDTYTNATFKLQIEEGETATEYVAPAGMVDYVARKAIATLPEIRAQIEEIEAAIAYDYDIAKMNADSFDIEEERYENIEYSELLYDISVIEKRNSVSAGFDTSVRYRNMPRSIKVVTNSTDGYSDVRVTAGTAFSMLGVQEIDVALYIEDATQISSIKFQTVESGMSRQITTLHNGWNLLRCMTYGSGIDTTGDRDAATSKWLIRIYTTESINVWIGSVVTVKPDKANLIIIEDAGYKSFYDIAYPAFKAIDAPVTWAIDPFIIDATDNKTGSRPKMGIEDMEVLAYDGLSEFSFHNYDGTYMSTATAEQALADTVNSIRWLRKHGYEPQRIFRGAWYQNNCPNHELADLELDASASYDNSSGFVMFPFPDRYNIPRYAMQGRETTAVDSLFEVLRRNHNTLLLYTHGISDYEQDTSETLLAYYAQKCDAGMQAGWLNCTTYNRLMNHYRRIR